ncbi:hypothetical protein BC834DRAFT_969714 [Gloeopeniophorella convolvens]|nr:hypothetical protein BC834DRAFT_969714 [Gloeopeniophorella convolvens]
MPAVRNSRRRRSSLALLSVNSLKHGNYAIPQTSPKGVTFAPNVTPVTFVEPENDGLDSEPSSPSSTLFPPALNPAPPTRKRCPPGKRRSQGYIPRPPNAFMLFRADFVRQKHVPGSIETNHGSLSKIIGNCWRALPLEEKRVWEIKAKHAKAEHKQMYPDYRFRPVHNKNKEKKPKALLPAEDEQRCEDVAQLLLEGMKGEELAAAVKRLDRMRSATPLNIPPFAPPVPPAPGPPPVHPPRRPSSAAPAMFRSWTEPFNMPREPSPLPEINSSLFNGSYLDNSFPGSFDLGTMFGSLPNGASPHELSISPLDNVAAFDSHSAFPSASMDPYSFIPSSSHSDPSSSYSGSPAPSDFSLPLHAPQPQRMYDAPSKSTPGPLDMDMAAYSQGLASFNIAPDMGLSYAVPEMPPLSFDIPEHMFTEAFQVPHPIPAPVAVPVDAGFSFNDMINEF